MTGPHDRLLRGEGVYAGDRLPEGTLWMQIVRSDVAAGRIVGIETGAARALPGVRLVLTAAEVAALDAFPIRYRPDHAEIGELHPVRVLATDAVRYVGEPVAAVVAETREAALDAAEAVAVEIEDRPAVTTARAADAPDAPQVWPGGNRVFRQELGDRTAYDAALRDAAHVVRARLDISCVTATPLEPRGALAVPGEDGVTLHTGTQATHRVRAEAAHVLRVPPETLRIVATDVGGSFGMRNGCYPEDVLAIFAARETGRPVRWTASRMEGFLSDTQSRPQSVDVTLALDAGLRFTALGLDGWAEVGAYCGPMSMHPMTSSLPALAGCYRTPVIHAVMRGMAVNRMHMAPYRGAGRPEAIHVVERMVDLAAAQLGVDRADLRRRNLIPPDRMPYATPLGFTYDSGDFPKALDTALAAADWDGFEARRAEAARRGRLRGLGLACAIESAGARSPDVQTPEFGAFTIGPDGALTIRAGSGDTGQGHEAAFAALARRFIGWEGPVTLVSGDTGAVPQGVGTFGSRTMGAAGQALSDAADGLIAQARPDAARHLGIPEADATFTDGAFRAPGANAFVTLRDLARATGRSYSGEAFTMSKAGTFPNGVHLAEIEIDPETGATELLRYTVVDDVGTVVDPEGLAGQVHGGVAQGLGQAFGERIVYDEDGALLSGSLMDYALPRAVDLPMIDMLHSPTPTDANVVGAKGVGESGVVGALSAGISAVQDALAPLGAKAPDMPATPHRIWQAIRAARKGGTT
ncbi:xanthine dehydrogenase family protein molybdopterin-binding subunit [Jannaschia formosa]|uniref:xanthine dehydrogenase family protein molybdopterin-binding subunit n=1 Tax=Jannaschia formosa TaxID=2259592 RepID=UPI001FD8118E|nr:xanthine dehydrogenase family protein molybdopterin-binding subunit [Jannaschia formosa]